MLFEIIQQICIGMSHNVRKILRASGALVFMFSISTHEKANFLYENEQAQQDNSVGNNLYPNPQEMRGLLTSVCCRSKCVGVKNFVITKFPLILFPHCPNKNSP